MSTGAASISSQSAARSPRTFLMLSLFILLFAAALWFFPRFFFAGNFLPHSFCYVGNTRLIWTTVAGDILIAISYVAISATLAWLVRRAGSDLPYSNFFWAFGLFIVSCGATHFLEVVTVWKPVYWFAAAIKIVTAIASAGTAILLLLAADDIVEFVLTARQAAARRGYERFRALINATPVPVMSVDIQNRVTAWNPAAERVFGWPAAEVLGKPIQTVPPDRSQESLELRDKTMAGKVTTAFETVRINSRGESFSVSISTAPIIDENGALTGAVGIVEDITERKRTEQELHEKTAILTAVTQALNAFLESGDWNAASRDLLDFALRQTRSQYGFLGVLLDGAILRVLAHDGSVFDLSLNGASDEQETKQDATQDFFHIPHVHNFLAEVIRKGQAVITSSSPGDSSSQSSPAAQPGISAFLAVPIFKGRNVVGLIGVANPPGNYTDQELFYLQTMSQATGVLYDNYRQSLKRAALEEQQEQLEAQVRQAQKMEVLGRLAGGVAHDFNNMLMVLGGCSELLDRSLPSESPARVYLDQIQRTTEKATAITKQLLAFSRKQVVDFRPMDLHATLAECELMLPRLLGSDIVLTFRPQAKHSWIRSDPGQIEQVLANLAINARDAMPAGGHLTISTWDAACGPADAAFADSHASSWVVLEVADTGAGMDEKTRAQIFEPFFTTKPVGKGTGLGLATVYGIVQQSHGHIEVHSAPGEGTRFEIHFPAIVPPAFAAPKSSPQALEAQSGSGATVLVADDQPALRHAVVEILRTSGYRVLEAETSHEALEIARQHSAQIDILLTDIVMPGLRGPDLANRVSRIHPETQVVYMSGYAQDFSDAEIPANSVFLQKPFRFATLLEQLKLVRRNP